MISNIKLSLNNKKFHFKLSDTKAKKKYCDCLALFFFLRIMHIIGTRFSFIQNIFT